MNHHSTSSGPIRKPTGESRIANGELAGPPLRMLFWESTTRCNLSCVHCRRTDASETASRRELTTDEFRKVLESAVVLGAPLVVFSGGEPLLRDDWYELARYAHSLGLSTALASNATLIDTPVAARIASAAFHRVSVSLDGVNAETHDEFRGVSGSFDRALSGITALRDAGVPLQINSTITTHNADQLDALHESARSQGAVALHLFLLVPVGCGAQIGQSHQLSPREYEQVLNWVCDRQRDSSLEIRATCAPHYYRIAAQRGDVTPRGSRGCLAGISVIFVSHDGEVFPCGYLPVTCGSVRKQSLEEIWSNSAVLHELRDWERLGGRCGRCEYKTTCGGCRARAYAATADYLASDPTCVYTPTPQ